MSLVFTAIVPHPPIAIPSIGKDQISQIKKTCDALSQLERDLYASKPDIVMIVSPHGEIHPDAFTINLADSFEVNYKKFGDFATKFEVKGDMILMSVNSEKINNKLPINIISERELDHGVGIPAYYLMRHLENTAVIPIYYSLLDSVSHYEFGKSLKELAMNTDKRIAVIASGDLSHCLTDNAPLPYNAAGKEFDEKLMQFLESGDSQSIVNLDSKLVEKAGECGLRSILILLGVLNNFNYKTEVLSYESPFGVGYLTANLKLG